MPNYSGRTITGRKAEVARAGHPERAVPSTDVMAEVASEVAALYVAVYRRFHLSHQPVPGSDLTSRMLSVLQHLVRSGPLTIGEQAQHLGLSKAATTEMIDRLEARGLLERMRDDRDRRRVFVWLTAEGRARAGAHPRVLEDDELVRALARMTLRQRAALVAGLRALIKAGEESEHDHDNM